MIPEEEGRGAGMRGRATKCPLVRHYPRGAPGTARSPHILTPSQVAFLNIFQKHLNSKIILFRMSYHNLTPKHRWRTF
jgi:hypothetical protein